MNRWGSDSRSAFCLKLIGMTCQGLPCTVNTKIAWLPSFLYGSNLQTRSGSCVNRRGVETDHRFLVFSFFPAYGRSCTRLGMRLCDRHAHSQAPRPGFSASTHRLLRNLEWRPRPSPVSCSLTILSSFDVVIFNPRSRCRAHRSNILMSTLF